MNFELMQRAHLIFGAGKRAEIGEVLAQIGAKRALVVCDEAVRKLGIAAQVVRYIEASGRESVVYDKVAADPPAEIIDEGADFCRAQNCGAVVAVGGGSSIDTAKGINLLRFNAGSILDYASPAAQIKKSPGLVVLPTTSGTGSELSDGLIVTDGAHVKRPILAVNAMSDYVILDPELMATMPPALTASTGMDALAHAVEAYTSTAATPLSDIICEGNIRTVVEWLPRAVRDGADLEARAHMAAASAVSGWMLCYGHTHAGHSVAHVIGARCKIPHGYACAYALPWVVEFNAPAAPAKTRRVGELLGIPFSGAETPEEIGKGVRGALIRFSRDTLGLCSVKEFGAQESDMQRMAAEIEGELFQAFNPRKMTAEDAIKILNSLFR